MRQPMLAEAAPAYTPSTASSGEGDLPGEPCLSCETFLQPELLCRSSEQMDLAVGQQCLTRLVDQAETAMDIERKDRDLDLRHYTSQQRRCLERTDPLLA